MLNEAADGADTIAWLLDQPWCDGNVGTYGASYLGFVQWAVASEKAAGLKAIAPAVTTTDYYYTTPWYSEGGALSLHALQSWTTLMAMADAQRAGSGRANTAEGDGELSIEAGADERVATFLYDPLRPVPTLGGRVMLPSTANAAGAVDQRPVEARDDVLCYSTPVLDEPLEVTGHITVTLFVSSSAVDTDFTGKLVDVFPDGRAIFLTDGIMRARYRNSLDDPELLTPGEVYELTLDLSVTSNVFLTGHRIRLEVSSSNFPRFDRNTNAGGVISEDSESDAQTAVNRIFSGPDHPSRLVLPVIRR